MSPKNFEEAVDIHPSTIRYHLKKLADSGLIEKRMRTERGQEGTDTYYRATILGKIALTEGINELIHGEQDFDRMYNSASKH